MSDNRFKIVFDGALLPGVDITTAKLNLADLFKSDVAAIERLFGGRSVALKRDLSQADAQTYLQALRKTGIDARIESEPSIELTLADVHEHAPDSHFTAEPASPYAPPRAAVGDTLPAFAALKPFSTEGRIGRLRYLAWTMVLMLVTFPIGSVFSLYVFGLFSSYSIVGLILFGLLAFILVVVLATATVLFMIQRLHDIGWSGWLWLLIFVPFVGSIFPLVIMVVPGNATANRYGPPAPPNTTAVKVLATLWLVVIVLGFIGGLAGGFTAIQGEYESAAQGAYESDSVTTDEIEDPTAVEVEPVPDVVEDSAEEAAPPVDSATE